jgi:hypothetical protein
MRTAEETPIIPVRSAYDVAGLPKKGICIVRIPANTQKNRFRSVYSIWSSGEWLKDKKGARRSRPTCVSIPKKPRAL